MSAARDVRGWRFEASREDGRAGALAACGRLEASSSAAVPVTTTRCLLVRLPPPRDGPPG